MDTTLRRRLAEEREGVDISAKGEPGEWRVVLRVVGGMIRVSKIEDE